MSTGRILGVDSTATNEIPAKIASGEARIAVVMEMNAGDYWGQWTAGLQREAKRFDSISPTRAATTLAKRFICRKPWRRSLTLS